MPELPEVETIKRGLEPLIVNKKIIQVDVDHTTQKCFQGDEANVVDATVTGLRRRGKALLIDLDNGYTMMIHLRMTGQLIWRDSYFSRISSLEPATAPSPYPKYGSVRCSVLPRTSSKNTSSRENSSSRISSQTSASSDGWPSSEVSLKNTSSRENSSSRISSQTSASSDGWFSPEISSKNNLSQESELEDGEYEEVMQHQFAAGHPSKNFMAELPNGQTRVIFVFKDGTLYFNDQRKFGFVKVLPTGEVEQDKFIAELAKEPWEMSVKELFSQCQRHGKSPIKAVLLDQKVIAGLGNIYADESLYYASVHPATRAGELNEEQVGLILEGARSVMLASIDSGGSTMATYVKPDGSTGSYLENFAQVFRREGKPCIRCGATILKTRVAGRGTHYCPDCQKAPSYFSEEK